MGHIQNMSVCSKNVNKVISLTLVGDFYLNILAQVMFTCTPTANTQ